MEKKADKHKVINDIMAALEGRFPTPYNLSNWDEIFEAMWVVAVAHKNPSFTSEREYRILTLPTSDEKRFDRLGGIKVVTTPTQIKKCLCIDLKKGCAEQNIPFDDLVKKIIIGPKSSVKKTELRSWLNANGLGMLEKRFINHHPAYANVRTGRRYFFEE